jgi:hypothetical protein
MEIVISVICAAVALSCLFAVVRSDLRDRRKTVRLISKISDPEDPRQ